MTISAKVIKDSIANGIRITTFELEYPRFIHGEFMTHRLFSRNAASSRAIPIDKVIDNVSKNTAMPVYWGMNKSGMQAEKVYKYPRIARLVWKGASKLAIFSAKCLKALGLHKQIVNRVLEPFQNIKVVVTATDYDNFFYLRCHKDAQPEIQMLADKAYEALLNNEAQVIYEGNWHVPYVETRICDKTKKMLYYTGTDLTRVRITEEEALKISASCCAQVSYRKLNESLSVAKKIYNQLVTMKPVHASPFEHQATPIKDTCDSDYRAWEDGVTHCTRGGEKWSGNFRGWIQHRQLIKDHTCWEFTK